MRYPYKKLARLALVIVSAASSIIFQIANLKDPKGKVTWFEKASLRKLTNTAMNTVIKNFQPSKTNKEEIKKTNNSVKKKSKPTNKKSR